MLDFLKRSVDSGPPAAVPVATAPPEVPGSRRPLVLWADAHDVPAPRLSCPNCGSMVPKPPVLTVRYARPDVALQFARLMRCPECSCVFYEKQTPPDAGDDEPLLRGRVPFHLQQGAGIGAIAAPLARAGMPPGSRFLDVGCRFGFALDYAQHALGWRAQGIGTGPVAAFARDTFGAAIDLRPLGDDEPALAHAFDVVTASETLERVPSPLDFLRRLRGLLRPGGLLVLATPNGGDVRPETARGALTGLLSPGARLVLQTRESLLALLRRAGFSHANVEEDGSSLLMHASDHPFTLRSDPQFHAGLVDYLWRRARDFPPGHDLHLGLAGRALQEAVNAGAMPLAAECYQALRQACQARFGIDLDTMRELPPEAAHCSLERLAQLMPLSLGGLLYADTMRRLAEGAPRPPFEQRLLCAADATDAVRRAAAELTLEDALSEEIGWIARAEAALCAAVAGDPGLIAHLRSLPKFPGRDDHRRHAIRERALIALVNAGHHDLAVALADETGLQHEPWTDPARDADPTLLTELERDALLCLAVLDMRGDDLDACARALRRFAMVRRHVAAAGVTDLYWSALRGEVQALARLGLADRCPDLLAAVRTEAREPPDDIASAAHDAIVGPDVQDHLVAQVNEGRYAEAQLLADFLGEDAATGIDRAYCFALLDARPGGYPIRAARRFAKVQAALLQARNDADAVPELYWAALRGEIGAIAAVEGNAEAEAARRRGLRNAGAAASAVPLDLQEPLNREDGAAA